MVSKVLERPRMNGQDDLRYNTPAYWWIREADKLPSTDEAWAEEDFLCRVKLFGGAWTWYIAGYDPERHVAVGLVDGFEVESGDIDMTELAETRIPVTLHVGDASAREPLKFGIPIERDLYWTPKRESELRRELGRVS